MPELTFEGGLNEQDDTIVDPRECTEGYNFRLGEINSHFRPRLPFDKQGTAVPNAGAIRGIIQLIETDESETTIVQAGDTVYNWDGLEAYTSVATVSATSLLRGTTWSLGNYSVITDLNKETVLSKWDGLAFTTMATGLTAVSLYAKYSVVHLGRVWLFNVKAGTDTPHMALASALENPESYDLAARATDSSFSTGDEAFYMLTPDLKPINGVAKFYDTLVISTEDGLLYKLIGSDANDFEFIPFYTGSAAVGSESIANTGNDVVFMRRGGVIESLGATDRFGDISTDDLSIYIRNTTEELTGGIFAYDQTRQRVYCFTNNRVLALNKNMMGTGLSPWSVYRTNHASDFNTLAATYIRDPDGTDHHVYFGDDSGNIYHLDGSGNGDAGTTDIPVFRRSKELPVLDSSLQSITGRLYYKRTADVSVTMTFEWTDDYSRSTNTIPLDGPPTSDNAAYWGGSYYWGGAFYWNAGFEFTKRISSKGFSPVGIGPSIYIELYAETDQNFDILRISDEQETPR